MGLLDRPSTGISVGRGLDRLAEFQGNLLMGKIQAQNEEARQKDYFEKLAAHEEDRSLNELVALQRRLDGEQEIAKAKQPAEAREPKAQDQYRERELAISEKRANLDALSKLHSSAVERYQNAMTDWERMNILNQISGYEAQIAALTSGVKGLASLAPSGFSNVQKAGETGPGNPLKAAALGKR